MARSPKNGKSGPTEVVATTLLMPPPALISTLSNAKRNARKQARDAGQIFSDKFSKAQEEKHVDRRAANIAFNLDSLSDEQLHVTYFHLLRYMDDLDIPKRAKAQEELFEGDETDKGHVNGKGAEAQPVGSAARKIAEHAGASLHKD